MQGHIVALNAEKKYGFIETKNGDVFFHRRDVGGNVNFDQMFVGQAVQFEMGTDPRGRSCAHTVIAL